VDVSEAGPEPGPPIALDVGEHGFSPGAVLEGDELSRVRINQLVDTKVVAEPVHALVLRVIAGNTMARTRIQQLGAEALLESLPQFGDPGTGVPSAGEELDPQ